MYRWLRPVLFTLPAEYSHEIALKGLRLAGRFTPRHLLNPPVMQPRQVMNLHFSNPVGLAAGLDKDATCIDGLGVLGFGFLEVGTLTPEPQAGHPKPRLFRLPEHEAMINRMGFNNQGVQAALSGLKRRNYTGVLGVNIGKNKTTRGKAVLDDYSRCLRAVYTHADYVNVNLSSPNTPGLRQLQESDDFLDGLLHRLIEERKLLSEQHNKHLPLVLKIAPDLATESLHSLIDRLIAVGFEGIAATNTTTVRPDALPDILRAGGLSGKPLHGRAVEMVGHIYRRTQGELAIIGIGGVTDENAARNFFEAGADLVQLYTGLIYQGPGFPRRLLGALS